MRPNLAAALLLGSAFLSGGEAAAQTAGPFPWDVPTAEAFAQLQQAGFQRRAADEYRIEVGPGGAIRRIAADTAVSTYTRESGAIRESVFVRTRNGRTVQMLYSAIGDSAALQAKIDAVGAESVRKLGADARRGFLRRWQGGAGQQVSVPAGPTRLLDTRYQFVISFHQL